MKTKHPQLLYESKLYKIHQGGSAHLPLRCTDIIFLYAMPVPKCEMTGACHWPPISSCRR